MIITNPDISNVVDQIYDRVESLFDIHGKKRVLSVISDAAYANNPRDLVDGINEALDGAFGRQLTT